MNSLQVIQQAIVILLFLFRKYIQKIIADEFNMHDAARGGVTKKSAIQCCCSRPDPLVLDDRQIDVQARLKDREARLAQEIEKICQ